VKAKRTVVLVAVKHFERAEDRGTFRCAEASLYEGT
jgi:hypothetical protein